MRLFCCLYEPRQGPHNLTQYAKCTWPVKYGY
jgi:hypothetical protein